MVVLVVTAIVAPAVVIFVFFNALMAIAPC
jgi:hypothetical protein